MSQTTRPTSPPSASARAPSTPPRPRSQHRGLFADILATARVRGARVRSRGDGALGAGSAAGVPPRSHRLVDERDPRRDEREPERDRDDEPLAPFAPPPPVLAQLAAPSAPDATSLVSGSAAGHAEAAALAERLVTQLSVGRIGKTGHELRMRVATARGDGLGVRLRLENGSLTAVLSPAPGARAEAERIADALRTELRARGVDLDDVSID